MPINYTNGALMILNRTSLYLPKFIDSMNFKVDPLVFLFMFLFTVQGKNWFLYIDTILLIICGGIPWQPYYQRALAVRTTKQAQILSIFATIGCFLFMIPPVLIGGIAKATNLTDYGSYNVSDNPSIVLPVSLAALVPYWVSIFGLSAIR